MISESVRRMDAALGGPRTEATRQMPQRPAFEVHLIQDPLAKAQELRERLEAVDPELDRINQLANMQDGLGKGPDGLMTWAGRRCCFLVVEFLETQMRHRPLPFSAECPACKRRWGLRVRAGLFTEQAATDGEV